MGHRVLEDWGCLLDGSGAVWAGGLADSQARGASWPLPIGEAERPLDGTDRPPAFAIVGAVGLRAADPWSNVGRSDSSMDALQPPAGARVCDTIDANIASRSGFERFG